MRHCNGLLATIEGLPEVHALKEPINTLDGHYCEVTLYHHESLTFSHKGQFVEDYFCEKLSREKCTCKFAAKHY
jgi:hypothetical protein